MDVVVVAIEPQVERGCYDVAVEIGTERRNFAIRVEEDTIGGYQLQVITGAPTLQRELHHRIVLDTAIRKVVGRCYNGKPVTVPVLVGDLPEGAFASPQQTK